MKYFHNYSLSSRVLLNLILIGILSFCVLLFAGVFFRIFGVLSVSAESGVIPASWNRDIVDRGGTQNIVRQYTGWKNYFDGTNWQPISLTPRVEGNQIIIDQAPYTFKAPVYADSPFIFENDGIYDMKKDQVDRSPKYVKSKQFRDVDRVFGQNVGGGILYENAFTKYQADLFIKPMTSGVQYLIKLDQMPPDAVKGQDVSICFDDSFSGTKGQRGIKTMDRVAYDSSSVPKIIDIQYVNGCKIIPWDFIAEANFPVYADDVDTLYVDTFDAWIGRDACGSTSWSTMVNAASSNYDGCEAKTQTATTNNLYEYQSGGTNANKRTVAGFQNALAVDDDVTAVSYCIYVSGKQGSGWDVVTTTGSTVSNTTLNSLDYGTFPKASVTGLQEIATRVPIADIGTGAYECIPLNASGISYIEANYNSIFWLGLRGSHDADGAGSGLNNALDYNSDNHASNQPYVEITYTPYSPPPPPPPPPSSGTGSNLFGSGTLVLFHTLCDTYEVLEGTTEDGSGTYLTTMDSCAEWTTTVELPAVGFSFDSVLLIFGGVMVLICVGVLVVYFVFFVVMFSIWKFLTRQA